MNINRPVNARAAEETSTGAHITQTRMAGATPFLLNGQHEFVFIDPSEPRPLPRNSQAFWTLNRASDNGLTQTPYRLEQMDFVLKNVNKNLDTYMSQAFFSRPNRRALHVETITHCIVDLDTYSAGVYLSPDALVLAVLTICRDAPFPPPSVIISSGRGYYLKWYLSDPAPRAAAGRIVAINRALMRGFSGLGSDPKCVDISRILRVVGTVNSKSRSPVDIIYQSENNGSVVTYDIDELAEWVLPYTPEQIRVFRQQQAARYAARGQELTALAEQAERRRGRLFSGRVQWCWGVIEDIRTLVRSRNPEGYALQGERDMVGHIGASMLGAVVTPSQLWHEIQAWARLILPTDYCRSDLRAHSSTLLRRVQTGLGTYKYKGSTILERLQVTPDEERLMGVLISRTEKLRRDREAWRATHTGLNRAEYEAAVKEGSREQSKPWQAAGISRATWYRRQSKGHKI